MSYYTPFMSRKLRKTMIKNEQIYAIFGKFRKEFLCKVYRSIYIGSNSLKNL